MQFPLFLPGVLRVEITVWPQDISRCDQCWSVLALLRFVNDFYRPDLGVIDLRRKREQQFALAIGVQAVEFAAHGLKRPRRCLKNVEVLKQQDAIARDIEDSAPRAPAVRGWNQWAEERFEEMQ